MKFIIKLLITVSIISLAASAQAFAFEPYVLKAQGRDVVINYPYPVQNILPGKKISFTAEYTGTQNTQGMDWTGTVCGNFVLLKDVGKTASFNKIQMPKVGKSCLISLTAMFQDYDAVIPMGYVNHTLSFANPGITYGTNPIYYQERYFVQSSVPQGHSFSYWKWRITGCDKGSTAEQNQTTSKMNFKANGKMCKIIMTALEKYDGTEANNWANNKFVVYSKTINYNPLD